MVLLYYTPKIMLLQDSVFVSLVVIFIFIVVFILIVVI